MGGPQHAPVSYGSAPIRLQFQIAGNNTNDNKSIDHLFINMSFENDWHY